MASEGYKKMEKQVSDAVSSPIPSEDTITQLEEKRPSIETTRTSVDSGDSINVASQIFGESCKPPNIEPSERMQKLKNCLTCRNVSLGQFFCLVFFSFALLFRLLIPFETEFLAEFCLLCMSSILCTVVSICYDRGYYARSVFEDSQPRKAYVDSPEKLGTRQKSASAPVLKIQRTSSTIGSVSALVHPPPLNLPESPIAMAAYSEPYAAVPGPSGQQNSS